ncbi:MAG: hypothetical protein EXR71_00170 [Myxococcales bacterium]|nr:hypothetical protein [Myxococcales bacterium]
MFGRPQRLPVIPPIAAPTRPRRVEAAVFGGLACALTGLAWADPTGAAGIRFRFVRRAGFGPDALYDVGAPPLGGYPFDAVLTLPLAWSGGTWPQTAALFWLFVAGWSMAWLAEQWWGSPRSGLLAGAAWQLVLWPALAVGGTAPLAALALVPLAWGLMLRALQTGGFALAAAAALMAMIHAVSAAESRVLLVLVCVTAAAAARLEDARTALARLVLLIGATLVVCGPVIALRVTTNEPFATGPDLLAGTAVLLPFAAIGGVALRRRPHTLLLPGLALLGGLGPDHSTASAAVGVVLLASALPLLLPSASLPSAQRAG